MKNYWESTTMGREVHRNLVTGDWTPSRKLMTCPSCRGGGVRYLRSREGRSEYTCRDCAGHGKVSHGLQMRIEYRRVAPPDELRTDEGPVAGAQVIGTKLGVYEAQELGLELFRRAVAQEPIPSLADDPDDDWQARQFREARQALVERFLDAAESVAQVRWSDNPFGGDSPTDRMVEQLTAATMNAIGNLGPELTRLQSTGATYRQAVEAVARAEEPVEFEPEEGDPDWVHPDERVES